MVYAYSWPEMRLAISHQSERGALVFLASTITSSDKVYWGGKLEDHSGAEVLEVCKEIHLNLQITATKGLRYPRPLKDDFMAQGSFG